MRTARFIALFQMLDPACDGLQGVLQIPDLSVGSDVDFVFELGALLGVTVKTQPLTVTVRGKWPVLTPGTCAAIRAKRLKPRLVDYNAIHKQKNAGELWVTFHPRGAKQATSL